MANASLVVLFGLLTVVASRLNFQEKIKGDTGLTPTIEEVPFVIHFADVYGAHVGQGAIICKKWAVSTADAISKYAGKEVTIRAMVGSVKRSSTDNLLVIEKIIVHEKYNPNKGPPYPYDVALVRIKFSLEFSVKINKIRLPSYNYRFQDNETCTTYGWGNPIETEPPVESLLAVTVNPVNFKACSQEYHLPNVRMMCAGRAGVNSCGKDDFGGLLVCNGLLAGVFSYNRNCTQSPSVYSAIAFFKSWFKVAIRRYNAGH